MNKPTAYDETQAGGDFIPVELGAHYGVIKNVSERETKNGDPMIVVSIDFDKKDSQPGYFTEMFKKDVRPDKKYPNQAVNYIMTEYQNACTKGFKSFMKAFADSNGISETAIKWGSDFTAQFKNKKIGVVYGNVEELYNGELKMHRKIRWFCDYNKVPDQRVPEDKLTNPNESKKVEAPAQNSTAGLTEDIPFE
jgi:hypothetical protein